MSAVAPTRRRGVLGGLVVIAAGVPFLLQPMGVPNAPSYLFITLGAAFTAAYFRGNRQYVYLVPAAVLGAFGIGLLLPSWITIRPDAVAPVFLGALAAGLFAVFILAPARRWVLIPAAAVAIVAIAEPLTGSTVLPPQVRPYFVPLVMIAVGVYLLVESQG